LNHYNYSDFAGFTFLNAEVLQEEEEERMK